MLIRWWSKKILHCFNFRITISGERPITQTQGVLFVANHISWTDIYAINSIIPVRFVAKQEIGKWPVFGYLVRKSGTIFINREVRRDASRVLNITSSALQAQDNLCVFPEGTTTTGVEVLPFKSSLIQSAIDAQANVIPITIHYPLHDGTPNTLAAYYGEVSLAESMQALLNMKQPHVHLHFGAAISSRQHSRQTLAQLAQSQIAEHLKQVWQTTGASTKAPY